MTHVLITMPVSQTIEADVQTVGDWSSTFAVYGPAAQATCEAAAAHLDHETTTFVVAELQPLDVPQSALSKHMDEQAAQRAAYAEELRPKS